MPQMRTDGTQARPVRTVPDPLDHAWVSFSPESSPFTPDQAALIYDESPLDGCSLVVLDDPRLQPDVFCRVQVGRMDPVPARIAWRREIEPRLVHLGLEYLG